MDWQKRRGIRFARHFEINLIGYREERGDNMISLDIYQPLPEEGILVGIANSHVFERYDYLNLA